MYTYLGEMKLRVFGSLKKIKDNNIKKIKFSNSRL